MRLRETNRDFGYLWDSWRLRQRLTETLRDCVRLRETRAMRETKRDSGRLWVDWTGIKRDSMRLRDTQVTLRDIMRLRETERDYRLRVPTEQVRFSAKYGTLWMTINMPWMAQLSFVGQYWHICHIETCMPSVLLVAQKELASCVPIIIVTLASYIGQQMTVNPFMACFWSSKMCYFGLRNIAPQRQCEVQGD